MDTQTTQKIEIPTEALAQVMVAFIQRMPRKKLTAIAEADEVCWQAQANWGMNAQLQAQTDLRNLVEEAVSKISDHDQQYIAEKVQEAGALATTL